MFDKEEKGLAVRAGANVQNSDTALPDLSPGPQGEKEGGFLSLSEPNGLALPRIPNPISGRSWYWVRR